MTEGKFAGAATFIFFPSIPSYGDITAQDRPQTMLCSHNTADYSTYCTRQILQSPEGSLACCTTEFLASPEAIQS